MAKDKDLDASLKTAAGAGKVGGITPPRKPAIANVAGKLKASPTSKPAKISDTFDYDTAAHFAFLGAGQGGSRIANSFWDLGYRRVAMFNTTDTDFEGLAVETPKLSLDIGGAAKDMQLARNALKGRDEEVRDLLFRGWGTEFDCALICVGLGGGSGSGTALPLIKMARSYMEGMNRPVRVGAIISLPSVDEGQQVARNAVTAFNELLAENVSPIIIIDNDKVHELYRPKMPQLYPTANQTVSELLHLLNRLGATKSPHITFDRSEFTQLLDAGIVVVGSADLALDEINSPADVSTKIRDQLAESVLADVDLGTGTKAACIFVGTEDALNLFDKDYFAAGFTQLNRMVGSSRPEGTETVVHRGIYPLGSEGLQCYTMIAAVDPPKKKLAALAKEAGLKPEQGGSLARHLRVD